MKKPQVNELVLTKPVYGNSEAGIESHALITRPSRRRCQAWAALAVLMGFIIYARGDAIIDFSNHVEGVLDAPVYDVDAVTRLQGSQFFAELLVSASGAGSLAPVGFATPFQTGTNAGYWLPQPITIPGVTAGQRVWVQVRAWDTRQGTWNPQSVLWGFSKVFSVVLRDSPTPLVELESIRLGTQDIRVQRQGDNLIIHWAAFGNTTHSLESTTDLTSGGSWTELWRDSGVYARGISVTNAIVGERRFFRLKSWRSLSTGREVPGGRTATTERTER